MRALLLADIGRLEYVELPDPVVGQRDVLVQVRACGICGSDLHGFDGSSGRRIPPLVMGHEAAGIIAEVGKAVPRWKAGVRVTFDSTISCNDCLYCQRGLVNLCDSREVLGVSTTEYRRQGAFAEYVVVPDHVVYEVPESVSFVEAAMVEPLAVAVHAVSRARPRPDDTVLIVGCGVIGLLILQMVKAAGCERILVADIDDHRLEQALAMGAIGAFRADRAGIEGAIREQTHGQGADVAFEAVGMRSSVDIAISGLRKGGIAVLVGNIQPKVDLPLQAVVTRQLSLLGSVASAGEYPACIDLIASRTIDVGAVVSVVAPLSEGATWFERLHRGDESLLRVVLEP
jgi:L-iditol 2-dehydrogenase